MGTRTVQGRGVWHATEWPSASGHGGCHAHAYLVHESKRGQNIPNYNDTSACANYDSRSIPIVRYALGPREPAEDGVVNLHLAHY
jgi:hypothetical protein